MKKILAILAITSIGYGANAQELKSKRGEDFLPKKGDWAISFDGTQMFNYVGRVFTSGNNAPNVNFFDGNKIIGKKFTSNTEALRASARLGFNSNSTNNGPKSSSFDLELGLGKEWRKGSTRLQGYYGADAMLMFGTGTKNEQANGDYTKTGSSFGIGARGFIGAEYFLFPKISIGAEYGWGLVFRATGKSEQKVGTNVSTTAESNTRITADTDVNGNAGSIRLTLHF